MPLLEARDLTVTIGGITVCRGLRLVLEAGRCWAVLGRNGSGKTTLLHTLAGLRVPAAGEVLLDGRPLARLSRRLMAQRLGILFQDSYDPFPTTVLETALIGRHPHLQAWEWEGPEDIACARQALAAVDLAGLEARQVSTLSGGERRRLALATLLTQAPDVYLLDEPTNHLDLHHQIRLLDDLTRKAREEKRALLMALHDVNLAARFCDHVLLLFGDGETAQGPCEALLTEDRLSRLYGHPVVSVPAPHGPAFLPR